MGSERATLALALLAGCGGASATASGSASASASESVSVSASIDDTPSEPPPQHVCSRTLPNHAQDIEKLYIEITSKGEHRDVLRESAIAGLNAVPYAVTTEAGADVELHVEVAALTPAECKVKIFIMRLPQHDLLAIADGGGEMSGRVKPDTCLWQVGDAIVRQKLPPFLQRRLADKR